MEQTEARQLAGQLNKIGAGAVACTEDHFHGRWEKTHIWGVALWDEFFAERATLDAVLTGLHGGSGE